MTTIRTLSDRLTRHKSTTKDPRYWPFCICCHLAAPEHPTSPLDHYDVTKGRAPDVSLWSMFTTPNAAGSKEQHHLCPDCAAFQITQLVRYHKACKSKLEKISAQLQAKDKCGLRLQANLNPFKSSFCCKPRGHTDVCG